jgi:hypothetical protein
MKDAFSAVVWTNRLIHGEVGAGTDDVLQHGGHRFPRALLQTELSSVRFWKNQSRRTEDADL